MKKISVKAEGSLKIGPSVTISVYVLSLKVAELKLFVGFKGTASMAWKPVDGDSPFNLNMLDCMTLKINFVVEVSVNVGILNTSAGDVASAGGTLPLVDIELLRLHIHFWDQIYDETTRVFNSGPKDMFHLENDCPYDIRTVNFILPEGSKGKTIHTIPDLLVGARVDLPDGFDILAKNAYHCRILGWYTEKSFDPASIVTFPAYLS